MLNADVWVTSQESLYERFVRNWGMTEMVTYGWEAVDVGQ